jgi:hypothetical protein
MTTGIDAEVDVEDIVMAGTDLPAVTAAVCAG